MNIFNFIRRNRKSATMDTNNMNMQDQNQPQPMVNETLFVEHNAPVSEETPARPVSLLQQFLGVNYELIGFNEGYRSGNPENQDRVLSQIRADFRLVVDKEIDKLRSDAHEIRVQLPRVVGISPLLEKQLLERLAQVEAKIHELDVQKVLSVEDEGFVSVAVTHFRSGYLRGLEQYLSERFFASSTGLFNN
jgi:hypothetical protein